MYKFKLFNVLVFAMLMSLNFNLEAQGKKDSELKKRPIAAMRASNSTEKGVFVKSKEEIELEKIEKTTPPAPPKNILELTKEGGKDSIVEPVVKKEEAKSVPEVKIPEVQKDLDVVETNKLPEKIGFFSKIWNKIKGLF